MARTRHLGRGQLPLVGGGWSRSQQAVPPPSELAHGPDKPAGRGPLPGGGMRTHTRGEDVPCPKKDPSIRNSIEESEFRCLSGRVERIRAPTAVKGAGATIRAAGPVSSVVSFDVPARVWAVATAGKQSPIYSDHLRHNCELTPPLPLKHPAEVTRGRGDGSVPLRPFHGTGMSIQTLLSYAPPLAHAPFL